MIQPTLEPAGAANRAEAPRPDSGLIDLVRRAQREETGAQAELLRLFRRRIAGYVRSILRQPECEDDADRKSTRLNSSHCTPSRMPSSA